MRSKVSWWSSSTERCWYRVLESGRAEQDVRPTSLGVAVSSYVPLDGVAWATQLPLACAFPDDGASTWRGKATYHVAGWSPARPHGTARSDRFVVMGQRSCDRKRHPYGYSACDFRTDADREDPLGKDGGLGCNQRRCRVGRYYGT